jgi:protein O-GlcNAc transferase
MNLEQAFKIVQENRDDHVALAVVAEKALKQNNINVALNFYSELVRVEKKKEYLYALQLIYEKLERRSIQLIYLNELNKIEKNKYIDKLEQLKKYFKENNQSINVVLEKVKNNPRIIKERKEFIDFMNKGKTEEAYKLALNQYARSEIDIEIQSVYASLAYRRGHVQTAIDAGFAAFVTNPSDWVTLTNCSDLLIQTRKMNQIIDFSIAAVNLNPKNRIAWLNLGAAYEISGKHWESSRATKKAIEIDPKNAAAWTNLGNAYKNSGNLEDAIDAYQEAVKLDPSSPALWSNLLFGVNYSNKWTEEQIADKHFEFGGILEKTIKPIKHENIKSKNVLNIGFVSADLRNHPVVYFVTKLFQNLDKQRIKIYVYDNFSTEDSTSKYLKQFAYKWECIAGKDDATVTSIIKVDEIDILIDLSGHTAKNRLRVFAHKPAPVQATWLGHPNTTGLTRIDWKITDPYLDPLGTEQLHSEKLWRLPIHAAYLPLATRQDKINDEEYKVKKPPFENNKYITFGSCNNLAKLTDDVIDLWVEILKSIDYSRILIEAPGLDQQEYKGKLIQRFTDRGIDQSRLKLFSRKHDMQYLRYHEIDIALDPFPYGGGTTTCDLIWMGVPLITLLGKRNMGRIGSCFLNQIGHPELCATNLEEYKNIAVNLAKNQSKLKSIRLGLRIKMENSPLMDGKSYSNKFTEMLFSMHENVVTKKELVIEKILNNNTEDKYYNIDELINNSKYSEALEELFKIRESFGATPVNLFKSALSCYKMKDLNRAYRFMVDSLLREINVSYLPLLANIYNELNYNLPFYIISFKLKSLDSKYDELYLSAKQKLKNEFDKRNVIYPEDTNEEENDKITANQIADYLKIDDNKKAFDLAEAYLKNKINQSVLINGSVAAKRLKKYEISARWNLISLAINPLGYASITNFGNLLVTVESHHDSMLILEAGAVAMETDAVIWSNLAVAYNAMKSAPWEAEYAAKRSIALDPKRAVTWAALGKSLTKQGKMKEAIEAFDYAGELDPKNKGNELFSLQYAEEIDFSKISEAHIEWGKNTVNKYFNVEKFKFDKVKLKNKKILRIGFVSGDLLKHPVAYFMQGLYNELDRSKYELYTYFSRPLKDENEISNYFKNKSSKWINIFNLDDSTFSELVYQDEIDLLIDLSGHTAHNRLTTFAMKPAPVQVTYIGHPNTTGLNTIDWKIADIYNAPDYLDQFYSEKLWRMEKTHCTYSPLLQNRVELSETIYAVNETPAMKNGYITFGSFNNLSKLSPSTIKLWSNLLLRVKNSRLILEVAGAHQRDFKKSIIERFVVFGVDKKNIVINDRDSKKQYINYNEIDICLDPFPYNGGTTSCDLLWMGIPLITLPGKAEVSRLGCSFLNSINRTEWIASDEEDYINIALHLSSNIIELNKIRLSQRSRMEKSPLMNYKTFTRDFENALSGMFKMYLTEN